MIYFTSDLHLGHNKKFIFQKRGFSNIEEHDTTIINNLRELENEDILYVLGDVMFGNYQNYLEVLKGMLFEKHLIIGNHDTNTKLNQMINYKVFDSVNWGHGFRDQGNQYLLSHLPYILDEYNLERKHKIINIHGHTHSIEKENGIGNINVAVDAWNMKPVSFEEIKKIVDSY